jgi:TRAP transporter TAXI family solute receptor
VSIPSVSTTPSPRKREKHGLALWASVAVICVATLAVTYFLFVEPPPPRTIVIATGGRNGAYYAFAQKYADQLQKDGLTLDVRETAGSVENLKLLTDDAAGVGLAIIQSGVASPEECETCYALGSLYREPLWVFYRGAPFERLSQLAGKRIGVGPPGSGTYAVARRLLAANGLGDAAGSEGIARATLIEESVADSAKALKKGDLDVAFMVAALEADYVRDLLHDDDVHLFSFGQQEAYHRRFRFLSRVTLPAGLIDLGQQRPAQDVALLAPTAMLVARKDLHPALVPPLLTIATRIHGKGDELSNPGEFPTAAFTDFPVSEEARHFYRSGPPVLQRILSFWPASLVDRAKVMLIPLVMLLMPLLRAAPPFVRWRIQRKIYRWYAALRAIDERLSAGLTDAQIDEETARLREIEQSIHRVDVPLSYMKDVYHLRLHLSMLQEKLDRRRSAR